MGKNGDPQTGWREEGVLQETGCSFKLTNSNNCPQSRVNLYCVECGLVLHSGLSRVPISASAFPIRGIQDLR